MFGKKRDSPREGKKPQTNAIRDKRIKRHVGKREAKAGGVSGQSKTTEESPTRS